jgi:hypothetical protein
MNAPWAAVNTAIVRASITPIGATTADPPAAWTAEAASAADGTITLCVKNGYPGICSGTSRATSLPPLVKTP